MTAVLEGRHVVLVGRGLGAPTTERALSELAGRVGERTTGPVRTALLDHGERSLHLALDECRDAGARHVLVLPVQIPRDRYLETWTRKAVAHWTEQRGVVPGRAGGVDVRVGPVAGDQPGLTELLAELCAATGEPVTESAAAFRSPNWSEITTHRRHVLVCRGPRCSAHGGPAVARALSATLRDRAMGDDDVLVTQTGCLVPCNLGPIVVVHPDDVWYTAVDPDDTGRIVDGHLRTGTAADDPRAPRRARPIPDRPAPAAVPPSQEDS